MLLVERVTAELKEAMRAKDELRLTTIRALRGEILKIEKSGDSREITDEMMERVVKSQIKQRQDAIGMFTRGGRPELAEKEAAEIAVLRTFLPAQLTETELAELIDSAIHAEQVTSMKEMGKVMKVIGPMIRATGKDADNRLIAELVKQKLG